MPRRSLLPSPSAAGLGVDLARRGQPVVRLEGLSAASSARPTARRSGRESGWPPRAPSAGAGPASDAVDGRLRRCLSSRGLGSAAVPPSVACSTCRSQQQGEDHGESVTTAATRARLSVEAMIASLIDRSKSRVNGPTVLAFDGPEARGGSMPSTSRREKDSRQSPVPAVTH